MIKIKNMSFKYGYASILENINLSINKNDFVSIIGHNGSGKTTLLKLIIGLLKPDEGNILINGRNHKYFLKFKNFFNIGYINQGTTNTNLPISVFEVVNIGNRGNNKKDVTDILKMMQIYDLRDRLYRTLSGGQKQKVNIARCLIQKPDVLILDEPNSFLDYESQIEIMDILKKLNIENNITIVMVSHDMSLVKEYSNSIYILKNKMLKKIGSRDCDKQYSEIEHEWIKIG